MNERIRELSKQAWAWAEQQEYTDPSQEFSDILEQKFAQLIIQDIGQIVSGLIVLETPPEQDVGPYEYWNRALGTVTLEIQQHFYGDE